METGVRKVLASGARTGDIALPGEAVIGTKAMGDALVAAVAKFQHFCCMTLTWRWPMAPCVIRCGVWLPHQTQHIGANPAIFLS